MGLDSGDSAVVGSHGDDDGVVAEDLLRAIRSSGYWKQHSICQAAKEAGKTCLVGEDPADVDKIIRNTFIQGTLSIVFAVAGHHRVRRRGDRGAASDPRPRQAADRGRTGAVANLRSVRPDPDHSRTGGAEAMGRAAEVARQIGWYWGTLMGDNHYRRYVEHRGRTHPGEPVCPNGSTGGCATTRRTNNPNPRCC